MPPYCNVATSSPSMAVARYARLGELHRESSPSRAQTHSREFGVSRNLAGVAIRRQTVYSTMAFLNLEIFGITFTTIMTVGAY